MDRGAGSPVADYLSDCLYSACLDNTWGFVFCSYHPVFLGKISLHFFSTLLPEVEWGVDFLISVKRVVGYDRMLDTA